MDVYTRYVGAVFVFFNLAADSNARGSLKGPCAENGMDGISRKLRRRSPYAHTSALTLATILGYILVLIYRPIVDIYAKLHILIYGQWSSEGTCFMDG